MAMAYPTMDSAGFVTTPTTVAERILNDYRCTNHGQSTTILNLKSLTKTLQENAANISAFATAVESDLTNLYSLYLDDTVVEVTTANTVMDNGSENDCVLELQIRVRFRNGSVMEELARSIVYDNAGFSRLVELIR